MAREPGGNRVRQRFHVVAGRHVGARHVRHAGSHVGHARRFLGMHDVPPLHVHRLVVQGLVAGDAPDVRGHAVLFFQDPAGLEHLVQDSAAAE